MNATRNGIKLGAATMIRHMNLNVPDYLIEIEKKVFEEN